MSWLFSRALAEEYSARTLSITGPFAEWNVTPSPQGFWRNDKMIDVSRLSQFGPTLRVLTVDDGEALLAAFLADFPVRTSASPEKGTDSTELAPVCGGSLPGSLARFDPTTSLLKTHQLSLLEEGFESLETLPPWGMTADGELYPLPTPFGLLAHRALITSESGCGLPARAPTPTAGDAKSSGSRNLEGSKAHAGVSLTDFVKTGNSTTPRRLPTPSACQAGNDTTLTCSGDKRETPNKLGWAVATMPPRLPTPTASDGTGGVGHSANKQGSMNLRTYISRVPTPTATPYGNNQSPSAGAAVRPSLAGLVKRIPTPTVQDSSNNGAPSQMDRNTKPLNAEVGGPLNPNWVEWLMGWPIGWTDLNAPATDKFREWCASHGLSSNDENT